MKNGMVIVIDPSSTGYTLSNVILNLGYQAGCVLTLPDHERQAEIRSLIPSIQQIEERFDFVCRADRLTVPEILRRIEESRFDVIGIIPGSERGVEISDLIAKGLNLPHNDPHLASARANKADMRRVIRKAGIRSPDYSICYNKMNLSKFVMTHEFPVIVKTPAGSGSQNVFKCWNIDELVARHEEILNSSDYWGVGTAYSLVESFIGGMEYVVNGVADGRQFQMTDVWRVEKRSNKFAENLYFVSYLERCPSKVRNMVCDLVTRATSAVGVRLGPIHAEVKVDEFGASLVEIGSRLCGARVPEFVAKFSNFDPYFAALKAFIKGRVNVPPVIEFCSYLAIAHCASTWKGKIREVRGIEQIRKLPCYVWDDHNGFDYDFIEPTIDMSFYPLNVWLAGDDKDTLRINALAVHDHFQISIED